MLCSSRRTSLETHRQEGDSVLRDKITRLILTILSSDSAGCQESARNKLKQYHVVLSQALRSVWLSSLNPIVLCAWIHNSLLLPPTNNSFTFRNWFVSHECGLYFLLTMSLPLLKLLRLYAHGAFKVLPGFVTLQYTLVGSLSLHTVTVLCYL